MSDFILSLSRRNFLVTAAAAAALQVSPGLRADEKQPPARQVGLGFSLYGMKTLTLADGLAACREIGYDCLELPVMADWPADTAQLSAAARKELHARLADSGMRLSAIMENLPLGGDAAKQRAQRERLQRAAELGRELSPEKPPVVETILGGKVGNWDELKIGFVETLRDWAQVLADAQVVLAVKAHISNAMQRPEQVVWLLEQVGSPWIQAAYDYSHFQLQKLPLADTLDTLLPHSRFIHVKDSKTVGEKWQFALPGEGTIDYGELFRRIAASDYRGDVVVEVSGQVFSRPGYDPLAAARQCYEHLAPAMKTAGIARS